MRTRSRILNRTLLLLAGALALAGALLSAQPLLPPRLIAPWWEPLHRTAGDLVGAAGRWRFRLGAEVVDGRAVVLGAIGLAIAVLLVAFLATRRRRRTRTVLAFADRDGTTAVDESIADAVLADPLRTRADVLSSRTRAYRVAGRTALRVAVVPRSGADLAGLLADAQRRVSDWDALSGAQTPVVVHLADRSGFDRLRSAAKVR
jgi:hypothetical protein